MHMHRCYGKRNASRDDAWMTKTFAKADNPSVPKLCTAVGAVAAAVSGEALAGSAESSQGLTLTHRLKITKCSRVNLGSLGPPPPPTPAITALSR